MKKILLGLMVLAVALVLAAPAMAEVKLTSTGYMDVRGILIKGNIIDGQTFEADSSNAYYKQKMVIDPVLHINDKVRIFGRVTIMERFWEGSTGDGGDITKTDNRDNYRSKNNNFWWERLYLAFPLLGGHMYAGRMSGGSWGTWFQDTDANRDRVKYVRKFGNILVVGLVEQLSEGDGGFVGPTPEFLTTNPQPGDVWTKSYEDVVSYAVGAVIPFSKNLVWKPLSYNVNYENRNGWHYLFMNEIDFKAGNFELVTELNWRGGKWDNALPDGDMEFSQYSGWAEGNMNFGPFKFGLGAFYLEGEKDNSSSSDNTRNTVWGLGGEFQPYFLFFSEDVGLLWNSMGVPNGTVGASGFLSFYGKASYKMSESVKLTAVAGYLEAAEMELDGIDKELGWEFDLNMEWKLMDNLSYVVDFGYLKAGDYYKDYYAGANGEDLTNDPYGMRHMLVIQW